MSRPSPPPQWSLASRSSHRCQSPSPDVTSRDQNLPLTAQVRGGHRQLHLKEPPRPQSARKLEHRQDSRNAQEPTPTSVKKPAIPAWQEPCSSPYFFLYSRGEGRKEANHSLVSVCQSCGGAAERAGHFPLRCSRLGPGMPSRLGRGRKVSGIHQTSKIQALVPLGQEAAKRPSGLPPRMWGKRSSSHGN